MATYVVARVDEIPPGGRKIVDVAGRSIGIFNIGGEFFALLNRCPHQSGPLCEGRLAGFLESTTPGEYRYSRKGEILRCPWHGWEYDVRTGQSWFDPVQVRVRKYRAAVQSGSEVPADAIIAITAHTGHPQASEEPDADSGPRAVDAGLPGRIEAGPYVAETFPVAIEQQYVTVEIRQASSSGSPQE